jgi:hypothetical protein
MAIFKGIIDGKAFQRISLLFTIKCVVITCMKNLILEIINRYLPRKPENGF